MQPFHVLTDYPTLSRSVADLVDRSEVPEFFVAVVAGIRAEREAGVSDAHVLRNCPIGPVVPVLGHDDPLAGKYEKKKTFVGDFFTDVVAINRYSGKQTGFVEGCGLLGHLTAADQELLRKPYFGTPFARDALIALKNALVRLAKKRHRILTGDLVSFANQDGLHSRDKVEINDPVRACSRWLLKTYAFRNEENAERHADKWTDGVRGRVGDRRRTVLAGDGPCAGGRVVRHGVRRSRGAGGAGCPGTESGRVRDDDVPNPAGFAADAGGESLRSAARRAPGSAATAEPPQAGCGRRAWSGSARYGS